MRQRRTATILCMWLVAGLSGCGDDGEPRLGATFRIRQEMVAVEGAVPPPNPEFNVGTPPELNRARAIAYRAEGVSDADIEQVLVLMPGFLGGANDFDYLARRLIIRNQGKLAVWAVDRRSNWLEDHTGLDRAERERNPDIAKAYYFQGLELDGRRFAGILRAEQLRFLSEWGLWVHIHDLDALLRAARQRYPIAAVFLGGHSLGASIAPIYAAWDFGPYAGFEMLSGLVLLEGAPNPGAAPPTLEAYESTGVGVGFARTSLLSIRTGNPVSSLEPFVSSDLFIVAEILAMRAASDFGQADEISPDSDLYQGFFSLVFGSREPIRVTNKAALGLGFDNDFQPLDFARASLGSLTGGAVGPNPNAPLLSQLLGPLGNLLAPTDPGAVYTWHAQSADDPTRSDPTRLDTFAGLLFRGPTNFIEWYFPARLALDVRVVNGLNVARSGDWRAEVYGLRVSENGRVDVPVFAVGGTRGQLPNVARLEPYRSAISPTLRSGQPRASHTDGFRALMMDRYVHLDVLTADDEGPGGNGMFAELAAWLERASALAPRRRLPFEAAR